MACQCCQRWAPKHHDGSALPPCPGDAALKEARDLARLWYQRAKEAGWEKGSKCGCGAPIPGNRSECDACFECRDPERPGLNMHGEPMPDVNPRAVPAHGPPKGQPEDTSARDLDPKGELYTFTSVEAAADMFGPDSDMAEEVGRRFRNNPGLKMAVLRSQPPAPGTAPPEHTPSSDGLNALAGDGPKRNRAKTNDEKLHDRWIAEGKKLAYCQGPRRHFFIVGSKMYEDLLMKGCFHCGAFPEVVA